MVVLQLFVLAKVEMNPNDPTYAIIRYFVMMGKRTAPNPIAVLPPSFMKHALLQNLISLPHNVYHYLEGCDYLQRILWSGGQTALHVDFIFNDSIMEPSFQASLSNGLNVFLICSENDNDLIEMNISLSRVCPKNCLFWIEEDKRGVFLMPNVITSGEEFWDYLFGYSEPLVASVDAPLCVPLCAGSLAFPYFKPANITFFTLSSALGNWGVGTRINEQVEKAHIAENTCEALGNMQGWTRQEKCVDIIGQLYSLCHEGYKTSPTTVPGFSDQNYPPLLIAAPYTTKDVREIFKLMSREVAELKAVDKVVELEQTPNYCYDVNSAEIGIGFEMMNRFINMFHANRLDFMDIAAGLHCSFRFSPYLRLPLVCKSVNAELSYVSAKNNSKLAYSKDPLAYNNAIHKIGAILEDKLLASKTKKMLERMPAQVVAITDLPIEWMEVNGVPLGFSHDVCRIPETPASGLLTHYVISRFSTQYKIPPDILSKTLLVYGCREDNFKKWQDTADIAAQALGAKSVVCQNLDEFEAAVKMHKPELMIIDTHGSTNLQTHQSYIMMGKDKVYPKDIAERGIYARMIFISACNTAPCYNDVNTVGNGFLEAGASAVTSSYLPLDVDESSILYIRIMNQLNIAAREGIHRNWLAFISHILRTSFILTPIVTSSNEGKAIDPMLTGKLSTISMVFENRTDLYIKLRNGEEVEGLKYDYSKAVPHYLMYTTIGRADLIEFEVSARKRHEVFEKKMAN